MVYRAPNTWAIPGVLLRRIEPYGEVSPAERQLVQDVEQRARQTLRALARVVTEGQASRPALIISGWAARCRELRDGRRQIVDVLLPGDCIGLRAGEGMSAAASTLALTPINLVDATSLKLARSQPDRFPIICAALDDMSAESERNLINQIVRLGRQTAYERMAHFFL